MMAARSLYHHVDAVVNTLSLDSLELARESVAKIVGRDTSVLDQSGISRAALESLAENTSDGIVAPIFWGAIFGLPGLLMYKIVNTLDSMIGHQNQKYQSFGWASAKLDDLMNYFPARLTGMLIAVVSTKPKEAFLCMINDARAHCSPNAGWPESAMAGALGIRLSGPRIYDQGTEDHPYLNEMAPDPDLNSILVALSLYKKVLVGIAIILIILSIMV